ncbi:MAG: OadG family protein [Desulfobacterales bacterium]|nr:OadG family protein [Desulfobacterales bacterium]
MIGIENITNNNGLAMAAVGASIVFLGLVVLSFVISQIHKILRLWEDREKYLNRFKKQVPADDAEEVDTPVYEEHHLPEVAELAGTYRPLVEKLQEPFKLSELFEIANQTDMPHPHLSIQRLQEADILVARGDGTFTWNKQKGN